MISSFSTEPDNNHSMFEEYEDDCKLRISNKREYSYHGKYIIEILFYA